MIRIRAVEPGSIAEELEIFPGDYLLKIDGKEIRDYIDYQYGIAADFFVLTVEKADGEIWEIEIEKDADESIGLV
ncbi:MAG: PDZ domain-containing protein, partial [Halanaerobiales bacterium]